MSNNFSHRIAFGGRLVVFLLHQPPPTPNFGADGVSKVSSTHFGVRAG